ncbi:uncharacterized protein EAF01_002134 [Botrytis porri]|uniref:Uncharacterized protein n=1 Tax=Botrytis porri TaxID=87229 RepID=A0A4Z1L5Y9_9HELO|nr:uncharacterized protein EAF01_002134 [Botrytis porri]KAF7910624.1 hypothetical protein EAF01_002134 [Botrytis porri]TGO92301.1 hypothetical protein BPOR_0006g00410 [Botrytis porri]
MASNSAPRKPRKKARPLSFSTANIGTSPSQGSAVSSLTSPSQLVLGYAAGQLIRTPSVSSSFNIEDRKSPRSPTPRSKIASKIESKIASPQSRARVNHPYRALGNKADLAHFANSHSPFANTETSQSDLLKRKTPRTGEIPVLAKMANLHVGDTDALADNLMGDPLSLPAMNMDTGASAPDSNVKNLSGDNKILNLSRTEGNREKNQAPLVEPPTPAQEPLLTINSEFPINTDANKQQWKAAVKANNPPRNPFPLSIPNQVHRRTTSQGQEIPSDNMHTGMASSNVANAYTQMIESVEKANGTQGNSNIQQTTMTTGRNPFSGPAALDAAPDFEANFAEMMQTLDNAKPGELVFGMDMGGQLAQASSVGAAMRKGFEDGARERVRVQRGNSSTVQDGVMDSGSRDGGLASGVQVNTPDRSSIAQLRSPFRTSVQMQMQAMNHPTTQEMVMNTGSQAGGMSSAVQANTPDRSSTLQLRSPFQTSTQPANHSTTQQNITNNGNPFEGTSHSTVQQSLIDPSLGSGFSNTTQMPQSSSQGDSMNNDGYNNIGVQDDNASSSDIIGDFAREYGSANHNAWLTADMNESSIQETSAAGITPAANMIGVSPSTHANTGVNMVGSSTQAPLPNVGTHSMDGITFTGNNHGDLSSVSDGYNMNFAPNTSSQATGGALASGLGPATSTYQQSSPQQVIRQSSATATHQHTPNNSMGSGLGYMGSQVLNSPNRPVQSELDLRRSATPIQSAIHYSNAGSPTIVNAIARSTRSSSTLAAPEVSFDDIAPNPLHSASFHRDTPQMPDTPIFSSINPLHPPSFHQPTPRAQWPTSRVPIPPNPAVSGNTPGYFEPSPIFNSQQNESLNANSNTNLMNLNRDMLMQFNPAFQQHQHMLNQRGQNNLQLPQQFHPPMQSDQFEAMMNQAAMENEANIQGNNPPFSPPVSILNTLFRHRINQLENFQPLTEESIEPLRLYHVADGISSSLQGYNLNSPMPFDGNPPPRLPDCLTTDRRSKKIVDLDDRPLALNKLTVGENFECNFCTGTPNLRGIDRYNHDFVEIWGPAGRDWCAECKRTGKHLLAASIPEKNNNQKGKRPAKDPAGAGPTPKKPVRSSSTSSTKTTRSATATTTSYDRSAPLSEESNFFGDPLEILSPIDNMLINPFMHNLTCRGSAYRQIDLSKTKICLSCKLRKREIVNHGCHDEFTHIVALNMDGQWQVGYGGQVPGAGLRDGESGLEAVDGSLADLRFDVGRDLSEGNMTVEEINSIVNVGLSAGGVQASSGGMSTGGMNSGGINSGGTTSSGMQPTSTQTDSTNSHRNSIIDSRTNLHTSTSTDFDLDSDLYCDMNSILNSSMDSMFGNDDFSWDTSGWLSTHSTSTSNSSVLLPTPTLTTSTIPTPTPTPREKTHDHHTHMNRLPHRPISKSCMICPAPSVFLCDGCPLTLCEKCRYRLRDAKGWLNNLIYSIGVNHNRNDAFLLRSDDGGYHDYGKFWPVPAHVNGKGVFGDGGR